MDKILHHLTHPDKVYSRSEILNKPCPVEHKSGVYAWYFREIPRGVPTEGCITFHGLTLLYVGISPSKPSEKSGKVSSQNLYKRLRMHMNGNAYGSTLRRTLGCLLRNQLDLYPQLTKNRKGITFGEGESNLSAWMAENAFVTWQVHNAPWDVEDVLIRLVSLPLNLRGNESHPFHHKLSAIRKECKNQALLTR